MKQKGFTLIELMVMIMILMIFIAMAAPAVKEFRGGAASHTVTVVR
jgi:prepilin-type N-terminal cleavage/methylation domain-containing protein